MTAQSDIIHLSPLSKVMLGGSVLFGAFDALLIPVPYLVAWQILEQLSGNGPSSVTQLIVWAFLAILARWFCQFFSVLLSHFAALRVSTDLRNRLLVHLGNLPMHWHAGQTIGGLKKVFINDIGHVDGFLAHHIPDTISAILLPLVSLICLTWINWCLGLMLIVLFGLCIFIQVGTYAAMGKNDIWGRYGKALEDLNATVVEFVHGMPVIKLFNRGLDSFSRMRNVVETFKDIQILGYKIFAPRWAMFSSLTVMPFTVAAVGGAILYAAGYAPLEDVTLFLMLGGVCLSPLAKLVRLAAIATESAQSFARIRAIFSEPEERRGDYSADAVKDTRLQVNELCVNFGDRQILKDISFEAAPGTTTAIVGASGSGKSTLAAAIAGLEKIASGSVTVGGYELTDFPVHELSKLITPVFQSPHIFAGTVAENIALGVPGATSEEIAAAARAARCADFIEELPNSYDTRIGDGGDIHLSGGQRQRIALARMALRRTPIVVLDEATAYADAESEAEIQAALSELLRDRTVIVVAHRLHTIAGADQILVIEEGGIAECGTHESLLSQRGLYAAMWEAHHKARSWSIPSRQEASAQC